MHVILRPACIESICTRSRAYNTTYLADSTKRDNVQREEQLSNKRDSPFLTFLLLYMGGSVNNQEKLVSC